MCSAKRFLKCEHLRRPTEFRAVYERRCSVRDTWLTVYGRLNGLEHARIGFSVSRKVGKAVLRNRLRRLYREAFRLSRADLPRGIDYVLIPRSSSEPALDELKQALVNLAKGLARKLAVHKQPS